MLGDVHRQRRVDEADIGERQQVVEVGRHRVHAAVALEQPEPVVEADPDEAVRPTGGEDPARRVAGHPLRPPGQRVLPDHAADELAFQQPVVALLLR